MEIELNVTKFGTIIQILRFLYFNENKTLTELTRNTKISYAHACRIVQILNDKGIVAKNKKGRRLNLCLTKQGKEVAKILLKLF